MKTKSRTFVIRRFDSFPAPRSLFKTKERPPTIGLGWLAEPLFTSLRVIGGQPVAGFLRAEVIHREEVKLGGAVYPTSAGGLIQVHRIPAYYKRSKKLFAIRATKDVALAVLRELDQNLPHRAKSYLRLDEIKLNLHSIFDEAHNVRGSWIHPLGQSTITNQAYVGTDLEKNQDYHTTLKDGELRNLRAAFTLGHDTLVASVSTDGTVYFLEDYSLYLLLRLVDHLVETSEAKGQTAGVPPLTVRAEPGHRVFAGEPVVLEASASYPNPEELKFKWTDEKGRLLGETAEITVPDLAPGRHSFKVTVLDTSRHQSSDKCTIDVARRSQDEPPTADAGPDQEVYYGEPVELDGSGSGPDPKSLEFEWSEDQGAVVGSGMMVTLDDLEVGKHTFTLTVKNERDETASDTCHVTVFPVGDDIPKPPPPEPVDTVKTEASSDEDEYEFEEPWPPSDANPYEREPREGGSG